MRGKMKTLKKKSLKSMIVWFIILIIGGALIMIPGIRELIQSKAPTQTLDELDVSKNLEGVRVRDTIVGIYDYYCETTNYGVLVAREYLIDAGDNYIGLYIEGDDEIDQADALMEASWEYLNDEDDGSKMLPLQFEVDGTIRKMPDDSQEFLKEYLEWDTLSEDVQAQFLPYYVVAGDTGVKSSSDSVLGTLVVGGIMLVIGLILLIYWATGSYQSQVKKYIASSSNPELTANRVENFINNTQPVNKVLLSNEYICGQSGATTVFGELSQLIWAYMHVTTHRRNFVEVGKTYRIKLGFMDGSIKDIVLKNEEAVQEILRQLEARAPHVILGYTKELENAFRKDKTGFLNLKYNQVMTQQDNLNNGFGDNIYNV